MDKSDLSVFFHTKIQSNDFLVRLSNFSEEIYKTDFNMEKALTNNFGVEKKDKFTVFLRDNNVNSQSIADLKTFIDKLEEHIAQIPILSITLAFEPSEETLNLLNEWFNINIKKQYIFDISVNPNLIAGIAINFNGKYLDFSVKQKFDKIVKEIIINKSTNSPTLSNQVSSVGNTNV